MSISLKNANPLPGEIVAFKFLHNVEPFKLMFLPAVCICCDTFHFSKYLTNVQRGL